MSITYAGFIFYEGSPRFVKDQLDPKEVKKQKGLIKTGVFVNAKENYILTRAKQYGLDLLQLHGDESPELCSTLRKKLPVMKAFRIRSKADFQKVATYENSCDYFLFDTPGRLYGGNGITFDWSLLRHYKGDNPFFLSGGIGPGEVNSIKDFKHPAWKAVDINSRFETAPGIKNIKAIKQFLWDLNIS